MIEPRTLHPKLQAVLQTAEGLQQILGEHHEVIVHDLQHVESSIVAIYGNVTNRDCAVLRCSSGMKKTGFWAVFASTRI